MIRKQIASIFTAVTLMVMALFTAITLPAHAQGASATQAKTQPVKKTANPGNERILNYDIAAVLDKDGKMTVTERLTVNVENRRIKRGIIRSYPIAMRLGEDSLHKFGFELISTKLDGEPAKNKLDKSKMIAGMAIGDANIIIPKGVHTYEIVYETTGHVRQLQEFDEIYYNAIGVDVVFPIDKATFSLTLPDGTKPVVTKAYTGRLGERGEDYRMTGDMSFETTRMLKPKEGFTVVVGWPKGVITPKDEQAWASTHRTQALAIIIEIVILALAYFWFRHFRKKTPPIYPIFTPPADITPGTAAFMDNGSKYVPLMLQSDLMWSAVQGFCQLDFSNKKAPVFVWKDKAVENSAEKAEPAKPSPFDNMKKSGPKRRTKKTESLATQVAHALFAVVDSITLGTDKRGRKAHNTLLSAWNHLYQFYKPRLKDATDFKFMPAIWAWLIGQVCLLGILSDIWYPNNFDTLTMIWLPLITCGFGLFCIAVTWGAWTGLKEAIWRYGVSGLAILLTVVSFGINWYIFDEDTILTVFYTLMYLLPAAFLYKFHEVPTKEGIEGLQVTEGIKMYINIAEKHRLEVINAPDDTIEQYEAILPYAIALGCAEAWEKRFAPVLAQINYIPEWITPDSRAVYRPVEYETWDERQQRLYEERMRRDMFASFTTAVPVSVDNAIKDAITDSQQTRISISSSGGSSSSSRGGWSSGSSGGSSSSGSSGGGSGGGGVGGW